mgnify:CR=1 FL=1
MANIQSTSNYAIFFDNVRVDDLVKSWTVNLSCNGNIGTANIEFVYMEDIAKKAYDVKDIKKTQLILNMLGAIDSMTNVKIFVQNPFTKKFLLIFDGNIKTKLRNKSAQGQNSLAFTALDHMNWLNKTIAPIVIPYTASSHPSDKFIWEAMGIDTTKVLTLQQRDIINFKGKKLEEIINLVVTQALAANKIYSDKGGVGYWDGAWERMDLMADIDEEMINKEVMDYIIDPDQTNVDTMYVLMNDIFSKIMFEFYQDRDGVIRIKPPYWSQPVLLNHIIDPILITNMSDSSNYDNFLTRVIVTGGLDQAFQTGTNSDIAQKLWTPIGCYMSNGAWSNAQSVEGFEMGYAPLGASTGESTGGEEGVMGGEYNGNGNTQVSDLLKYDTATRINTITKIAASFYKESKIIPSITGAQSFTEAGAGTSTVAKQANNLFGIQAGSWKNDPTKEVYQGKTTAYRKYKSIEACVYDRVCNVLQQSNYTKYGLRGETDPAKALMAMKKGGYWTDGDDAASGGSYANLVLKTIKKYDLQRRYDEPCIKGTFSSDSSSSSSSTTTSSLSLQSEVESVLDDSAFDYKTVVNNSGYPKKRNDGTLIVGEGNPSKLEKLKGYGIWFPDIRTGIRAHIQHLSGLTRGKLISDNKCVDPSFCEDNIFINVVSDFDKIKNRNKLYPKKIFQCLLSIFDFCEEDVNVNLALSTPLTSYSKEKLRNYFSLLSQGKPIYINGNMTIQEFINVYIEEAQQENVSVYVALAQMIVDTGFLRWGAGQAYQQNNFAKLGAGDSREIIMTASDWY